MVNIVTVAKMVISTIQPANVSLVKFIVRHYFQKRLENSINLFTDCNCDLEGTVYEICDKEQGVCLCKEGYGGVRCDQCSPGYYNYPNCIKCNCSTVGSVSNTCDVNGKCPCLNNFAGKQCSQCSAGYYNYPQCLRMY